MYIYIYIYIFIYLSIYSLIHLCIYSSIILFIWYIYICHTGKPPSQTQHAPPHPGWLCDLRGQPFCCLVQPALHPLGPWHNCKGPWVELAMVIGRHVFFGTVRISHGSSPDFAKQPPIWAGRPSHPDWMGWPWQHPWTKKSSEGKCFGFWTWVTTFTGKIRNSKLWMISWSNDNVPFGESFRGRSSQNLTKHPGCILLFHAESGYVTIH